jgi:uncharacterized protein YndB with AHSA1/START domain
VAVIRAVQLIQRPIDEVFSVIAEAGSFARWNPTILSSRRISEGESRLGSTFEWRLRGFGRVVQEFGEFERNRRIRIVPCMKSLEGGHRFTFTAEGNGTRIDHELVMVPKGWFRLFSPLMAMVGRKNLRDTIEALRGHLESR